MSFQPYWLAYADFVGVEPESETLKPHEFILWIGDRYAEYRKENSIPYTVTHTQEYKEGFISWLEEWVREAKFKSEVETEEYLNGEADR